MTPESLLRDALAKVDSKRIREWVMNPHNYPVWLKIAETCIEKHKDPAGCLMVSTDPSWLAANIVMIALGAYSRPSVKKGE